MSPAKARESIRADGPVGYFSTLPVTAIAERLGGAGIPAKVSNTAGLYVCNHVFYRVMDHLASRESPPMAGLIHLPRVCDPVRESGGVTGGLPLETMVTAVELAMAECTGRQPAAAFIGS